MSSNRPRYMKPLSPFPYSLSRPSRDVLPPSSPWKFWSARCNHKGPHAHALWKVSKHRGLPIRKSCSVAHHRWGPEARVNEHGKVALDVVELARKDKSEVYVVLREKVVSTLAGLWCYVMQLTLHERVGV
jgi:hypothetical protein